MKFEGINQNFEFIGCNKIQNKISIACRGVCQTWYLDNFEVSELRISVFEEFSWCANCKFMCCEVKSGINTEMSSLTPTHEFVTDYFR